MRCNIGRLIHGYGLTAETRVRLVLQDETLLLPKHALLQESESRLLLRQTCQEWKRMLLQEEFVSNANRTCLTLRLASASSNYTTDRSEVETGQ